MNIWKQPVKELAYYSDITNAINKIGQLAVAFGCVDQQKPSFVYGISDNFKVSTAIRCWP